MSLTTRFLAMPLVQHFNPYRRLVWLMLELIMLATVGAFAVFKSALYAEGWFAAAKAIFFYLNSLLAPLFGWPVISAPEIVVAIPDIVVTKDDDKQPDPPSPPPPYSSVVPVQPVQPADKNDKATPKPLAPQSRSLPTPPSAPPPWKGYSMIPVKHYKDGKWSVYEAKYWNGAPLCRLPTVTPPKEGPRRVMQPRAEVVRLKPGGFRFLPNPDLLAPPPRAVGGRVLPARLVKVVPAIRCFAPAVGDVARPVRIPEMQIRYVNLHVPRVNDHSRLKHEDEVFWFPKLGRYFPREPQAWERANLDAMPGAFRLRKAVF